VLGFVAAPCVGPFAAAILLWLVNHPESPFFGFCLMASFGLGMGMLFLVLALFSQNFLPKAGMWMVRLKQTLGFLLILVAYYFVSSILPDFIHHWFLGFYLVAGGSLLGAFNQVNWEDSWHWKLLKGFGLTLFLAGLFILVSPYLKNTKATVIAPSHTSIEMVRDHGKALTMGKEENKPVLFYFGADWCIPCRTVKADILPDEAVKQELKRFVVSYLDCTSPDSPNSKLKIEQYKSAAMPFFAFYDSNGNYLSDRRLEGKISKDKFLEVLRTIQ
jgi:thiol:disulfide interchange protein DsbD